MRARSPSDDSGAPHVDATTPDTSPDSGASKPATGTGGDATVADAETSDASDAGHAGDADAGVETDAEPADADAGPIDAGTDTGVDAGGQQLVTTLGAGDAPVAVTINQERRDARRRSSTWPRTRATRRR